MRPADVSAVLAEAAEMLDELANVSTEGFAARVDSTATRLRAISAAMGEDGRVAAALDGITDLLLTQRHPEFGIECTVVIGDRSATVINQPSPVQAILNARHAINAARSAEEPTDE